MKSPINTLIVDDHPFIIQAYRNAIDKYSQKGFEFEITQANNCKSDFSGGITKFSFIAHLSDLFYFFHIYLNEKYPHHEFSIILGSDSFCNLSKWKNYEVIIKNYPLYIYKRAGFSIENNINANIHILDAPLIEISSTHIRNLIKEGKSIRYLLPDSVKEEIEKNNYYR